MHFKGKYISRSHNTRYCLIEVVTKAGLTVWSPILVSLLLGEASRSLIKLMAIQWPMVGSFILTDIQVFQSSKLVTLQSLKLVTASPTAKPLGPETAEFYKIIEIATILFGIINTLYIPANSTSIYCQNKPIQYQNCRDCLLLWLHSSWLKATYAISAYHH